MRFSPDSAASGTVCSPRRSSRSSRRPRNHASRASRRHRSLGPCARVCNAGFALVAILLGGCSIEELLNRIGTDPLPTVSAAALELHRGSRIVDLHADSLLWSRDLKRESSIGHVDLPRLRRGDVGLQMFTAVTAVPVTVGFRDTDERWPDLITLLALVHRWPVETRSSRLERALHQADVLDRLATEDAHLFRVRSRTDLANLWERRTEEPALLGALFGIEGAHALDGDPANLARLHAKGLRMVGLAHFIDNEFAGSAHGRSRGGLTDRGRELVAEAHRLGVVIDLAHSSAQTIDDTLAILEHPPVVSHTGIQGACPHPRNLTDEQALKIAAKGGVIGVGFWDTVVCGSTPADIARSIRYAVDLLGDRHVALGSDFDGVVRTPFDASGMAQITQALLDARVDAESIRRILGENALRVFEAVLPAEAPEDASAMGSGAGRRTVRRFENL